ncbi:MAG: hypothetical protein JJU37_05205 [Balneolaceae bacterium]|nr:hypothetical protein [Balneolaceae bacterium]
MASLNFAKYYNLILSVSVATCLCFLAVTPSVAQNFDRWETVMQEFERLDSENNYPPESIFFTGSSSIRMWSILDEDMQPYSVIQRGFGGSNIRDILHFADRYIGVHDFRALVLFVANDITGNVNEDLAPEELRSLFEEFIYTIRDFNSNAPIFIIEITPTNSRWDVWPNTREANAHIAMLCDQHENVVFIPTSDLFLDSHGKPIPVLFLDDQLHLNEDGYNLWADRIRSYMDPVLLN